MDKGRGIVRVTEWVLCARHQKWEPYDDDENLCPWCCAVRPCPHENGESVDGEWDERNLIITRQGQHRVTGESEPFEFVDLD